MADKDKNQFIVLDPVTDTTGELLRMMKEKDQAEIQRFQNPDEAIQIARQIVPCAFVLCMGTNTDVPVVFNTLKKIKNDIKAGTIKIMLISKIKNAQLQKLVAELGVTDFIIEPIPARTLQFKANLQIKALDNFRRQRELKKASEEKVVIKTLDKKGGAPEADAKAVTPKQKQALQMAEDTFLIKNTGIKKSGKKVIVEMEGPDPETGDWVQEETKGEEQAWRWQPKDEEGKAEGNGEEGWVCKGEKPQFKANTKKWQTTAEKPELYLKKKKEKVAVKLETDEQGEISLAADSPEAEENLKKNRQKGERIRKKKGLPTLDEAAQKAEEKEAATAPVLAKEKGNEPEAPKLMSIKHAAEGETPPEANLTAAPGSPENARAMRAKLREKARKEKEKGQGDGTESPEGVEEGADPTKPALAKAPRPKEVRKRTRVDANGITVEEEVEESADAPAEEAEAALVAKTGAAPAPKEKRQRTKTDKPEVEEKDAAETAMKAGLPSPIGERAKEARKLKQKAKRVKKGKPGEPDVEEEVEEEEEKEDANAPLDEAAIASMVPDEELTPDEAAEKEEEEKQQRTNEREAKKFKLLQEIHEELNKPLPDSLPEEEEAELRKKFGLEGRKDITAEDLVRKQRLEKVKKKREELDQLEAEQLNDDLPPSLRNNSVARDKLTGGLNVDVDAFGEFQEEEEEADKRLKRSEKKPKRGKGDKAAKGEGEGFADEDANGKDEEGEGEGKKRRRAKDDGSDDDEEDKDDLDGEEVAEDDPRSGGYAFEESRNLDKNGELVGPEAEGKRKKNARVKGGRDRDEKDELKAKQHEESPDMLGDKAFAEDEPEGDFRDLTGGIDGKDEKRRRRDAAANDDRDEADAKDAAQDSADLEKELEEQKRAKREKSEADAKAAEAELKAEREAMEKERLEKEANAAAVDKRRAAEDKEKAEQKERDQAKSAEESKKKRRDEAAAELEEDGKSSADKSMAEGEDFAANRGKDGEGGADSGTQLSSAMDEKLAAMGAKSAGMKEFLERRKQRGEELAKAEAAAAQVDPTGADSKTHYLGVLVAVSDSLGHASDRKLLNVLKAFESAFGQCEAAYALQLDEAGNPIVTVAPTLAAKDVIDATECQMEKIEDGKTGAVLGYLLLRKVSPRTEFTASQADMVKRTAVLLRPLCEQRIAGEKKAA